MVAAFKLMLLGHEHHCSLGINLNLNEVRYAVPQLEVDHHWHRANGGLLGALANCQWAGSIIDGRLWMRGPADSDSEDDSTPAECPGPRGTVATRTQ